MSDVDLFVGLPCYGGQMSCATVAGLIGLERELVRADIPHTYHFIRNESFIPRARNAIVAEFLQSKATHLLFIDSDIDFKPQDVFALLGARRAVVCGTYPKKAIDWAAVTRAVKADLDPAAHAATYAFNPHVPADAERTQTGHLFCGYDVEDGCIPIRDAATGFLLIERAVFPQMIAAYPETIYRPLIGGVRGAPRWALFDSDIENEEYLTEDYTFSRRYRALGGTIWMHLGIELGHVGQTTFRGKLDTLIHPGEGTSP